MQTLLPLIHNALSRMKATRDYTGVVKVNKLIAKRDNGCGVLLGGCGEANLGPCSVRVSTVGGRG